MNPGLKRAAWALNTCGFAFYLAWLATMGDKQILREQDGIVYFLPVLPFFFVYLMLFEPKPARPPAGEAPAQQTQNEPHDLHDAH